MIKTDVVVIGSGLFGSAIAKQLGKSFEVTVIDSIDPMAASKCSFGVWKDGWVNEVIKPYVSDGMELLEEMSGGIEEIEFFNMKKEKVEIFKYADCSNILLRQDSEFLQGEVTGIRNKMVKWTSKSSEEQVIQARYAVIVAAGVWTTKVLQLVDETKGLHLPKMDALYGATLDVKLPIDSSRMWEWAPYRQAVLVKKGPRSFSFGDGATVKNPKVGDPRIEKTQNRLLQHLNYVTQVSVASDSIMAVNEGFRPYMKKGSPAGFIQQHTPWLFSATGGAKNSTILCGHVAKSMMAKLQEL
jgi:hypothetical protein